MHAIDEEKLQCRTREQTRQSRLASFADAIDSPFSVDARELDAVAGTETDLRRYREDVRGFEVRGLHTVGGVDISFRNGSGEQGIAALSILSFPDLRVIKTLSKVVDLSSTPYVHSYLSFRESDLFVSLLEEARKDPDTPTPQVLFVDGNGRWHPRQAGSAVAVGVKSGLPTIGVAKEFHPLHIALDSRHGEAAASFSSPSASPDCLRSQKKMRKACQELLSQRGDWLALPAPPQGEETATGDVASESYEAWGAALLNSPAKGSLNPIFVSPGHRLSLRTCVLLTLACTRDGKIPEPIRSADLYGGLSLHEDWY
ncbi:hypothetical protein BMF94_5129 [Rhodotorula taiwanensis]|uniref:Endonuclease V n=1 Tax=Rhodotorula taiwanensis TaxID=741276 RepID=A0A2S5B4R7_9BASI|nr:hypothetical protein BMF94_5129 [Rhodotorula taiwanensis]